MFFFFSSRRRHTRLTCDWSSDVCSSDLAEAAAIWRIREDGAGLAGRTSDGHPAHAGWEDAAVPVEQQIGRASCRERVEIAVVVGSLKKKRKNEKGRSKSGDRDRARMGRR